MAESSRRNFLGFCASAAAALTLKPQLLAAKPLPLKDYQRVLLADEEGRPLRCDELAPEREYVFYYPYRTTPCFLIDLGHQAEETVELETRDGAHYRWRGGVGPKHSIVAFSAICAHKMSHPSPEVSFIGYRKEPVGFVNKDAQIERRAAVIQCCSEHSIYDPAKGAKVVSGPAPQPLAAIALEFDGDRLYATGVHGGEMFDTFFEKFGYRLRLEYGGINPQSPVQERTAVFDIDHFTQNRISCS
jgi:arsenite oxidase small subunit